MGQQSTDKGDGIRRGLWLAARVHEDMLLGLIGI